LPALAAGNAAISPDIPNALQRVSHARSTQPKTPQAAALPPQGGNLALLKVSGNPVNGLGETAPRRASPFFWDPPDQHPYGELQNVARQSSHKCPGAAQAFLAAYSYPELIPVAEARNEAPAEQLAE
jgi:hypothetical protein